MLQMFSSNQSTRTATAAPSAPSTFGTRTYGSLKTLYLQAPSTLGTLEPLYLPAPSTLGALRCSVPVPEVPGKHRTLGAKVGTVCGVELNASGQGHQRGEAMHVSQSC